MVVVGEREKDCYLGLSSYDGDLESGGELKASDTQPH
jgi:hypothetical protein